MNHIKHALRQLTLRPGLSLLVILMLALGLGATTAISSLFYQVLLQPLPVPEPHRLVTGSGCNRT
jgi:ABC-type proline/glycine betaine transport system permease subunit